ncbi:phytoene dehydrogenase-like protein [Bosea sp. BK604]|nr:phytoene dehydrogenase-like protein [Bosea sp. BK604]
MSRRPSDDQHVDVIVVGAGMAGLSAAALLAQQGYRILVVEHHDRPGGCMTSWVRKPRDRGRIARRFVFDAGVQDISGLSAQAPVQHLLAQLDEENGLQWLPVQHRYVINGTSIDLPRHWTALEQLLCSRFADEAQGISAFLREIRLIYDELYAGMRAADYRPVAQLTPLAQADWSRQFRYAAQAAGQPYVELLRRHIRNPTLISLFSILSEYVTNDPACLSLTDMVPLFGYYIGGGFYPAGGAQKLPDLLCGFIRRHHGEIRLKCRAERFILRDGAIAGIELASGQSVHAPVVISNADIAASHGAMLGPYQLPPRYRQRLKQLKRGPTAILINFGLDRIPDMPARVFVEQDGLIFGLGNPSAIDPSLAPPGHAALSLLHLLPEDEASSWFELGDREYESAKAACAETLIAAAGKVIPDLDRHIVHHEVAAPPTFRHYIQAENGSIYGAARGQWCPGVKSPVPGLFLAGAGTATGPGVEAAVLSGIHAAHAIMDR